MKKTRPCILSLLVSFVVVSCELDISSNGKLDGLWQVESVDTLRKDGTTGFGNKINDKLFWAFQFDLLQIDDRTYSSPRYLFRFEHIKDTLRIYDPYVYDRENGDIKPEDAAVLNMYGIDSTDTKFIIDMLSSKRLILKRGDLHIKMRKF